MDLPKIVKNKSKEDLLQQAIDLKEKGQIVESIKLYKKIIQFYPSWATPFYNLGLIHKYRCEWTESFEYNKKACDLNPDDEASQWNLGISATALMDWKVARMAWNHFGLNLDLSSDEPNMNFGRTPIRLNPDGNGEVVWGLRIDPARTIIENVPFPESNHRYHDLILNDGAPVGHRISNGREYPVFNELQVVKRSSFKTYSTAAYVNDPSHVTKLEELCENENIGFEDWSTIRILCRKCSQGIPHDVHDNDNTSETVHERNFGFGCLDLQILEKVLANWTTITLCEHEAIVLRLD